MNYETKDLLSVQHGIIVHGCNAQGKMGSGVAKAIRAMYPKAFDDYLAQHQTRRLRVGQVVFSVVRGTPQAPTLIVANAITQEFYGRDPDRLYVDYDGVSTAFTAIAAHARQHNMSVHYPLIGCGLANGDWEQEVAPRIEQALTGLTHTLCTPRPYDQEMALIVSERKRARATHTDFRSIDREGMVQAVPRARSTPSASFPLSVESSSVESIASSAASASRAVPPIETSAVPRPEAIAPSVPVHRSMFPRRR